MVYNPAKGRFFMEVKGSSVIPTVVFVKTESRG